MNVAENFSLYLGPAGYGCDGFLLAHVERGDEVFLAAEAEVILTIVAKVLAGGYKGTLDAGKRALGGQGLQEKKKSW
jgi:hypothetical protein